MTGYLVIENTPGYLPESEPAEFEDIETARGYAAELAAELEEMGYRVIESVSNQYGALWRLERDDTVAPDLGRVIEIVPAEESE